MAVGEEIAVDSVTGLSSGDKALAVEQHTLAVVDGSIAGPAQDTVTQMTSAITLVQGPGGATEVWQCAGVVFIPPLGPPEGDFGGEAGKQTTGAEAFLVVGDVEMVGDDVDLVVMLDLVELWGWEGTVDGKSGGAVFKLAVRGPFVTEQPVCQDSEAIVAA